jgi:nitrate/TMAO reductase-like tetraheme cytochrome c subunit
MHGCARIPGPRRRRRWTASFAWAAFLAVSTLAVRGDGAEMVNPHLTPRPKFCLNCHTEEIFTRPCGENEGYCLLAGSVDALCLTCHVKEDCCRVGQEHLPKLYLGQRTHPSDVEPGEIPRAYAPKTLPIHRGRITCRTCHLHTQEGTDGYKMLRIVKAGEHGVDWSVLCKDCHKDR